MIRAASPVESTLETLAALTSLALVCDASPTDLFHLPAPTADEKTRPLLALAAKRAADTFAGHQLHIPTDDKFPTYGHPYGLSFYSAIETLPALYQAYGYASHRSHYAQMCTYQVVCTPAVVLKLN